MVGVCVCVCVHVCISVPHQRTLTTAEAKIDADTLDIASPAAVTVLDSTAAPAAAAETTAEVQAGATHGAVLNGGIIAASAPTLSPSSAITDTVTGASTPNYNNTTQHNTTQHNTTQHSAQP